MSKSAKKAADQAEREKVHKRYSNRREPDVIYPAKKQVDFYDADITVDTADLSPEETVSRIIFSLKN